MANESLTCHMTNVRLIDANALVSEFMHSPAYSAGEFQRIARRIHKAPTVDAVEVVHGEWIDSHSVDHMGRITEHGIDCSVCDSVFKDDSREVVKHWKERFKVCPFCGAVMDGDGNG